MIASVAGAVQEGAAISAFGSIAELLRRGLSLVQPGAVFSSAAAVSQVLVVPAWAGLAVRLL